MKTIQGPLPMSFAVEELEPTKMFYAAGGSALVPNAAAVGMATFQSVENCLGTIINSDYATPRADEFARALQRRYLLAQYALGRRWLNLRVQFLRGRAFYLANRGNWAKRSVDVTGSLALLILLAPLFLLIAALVWLEDRGPVFFAQTRVGRHGEEFKMYKVRSMCRNAEERLRELLKQNSHKEGVTFKIKDDPRITRVGKWLRKFSLDELPQLYNVLVGDMSLVGPRPPVPREVALYQPEHRRRLAARPGVTCLWQVSGRSEIDFSGQVKLDVEYIENQSLWLDLKILARTIPAVISGKGAC